MAAELGVTATAVRNRLSRLVGAGLVERHAEHGGRGRPRHVYRASLEAHRRLGQNYADLAVVLWDELMRNVEDRKLRRVLFGRITDRLAELYRAEVRGIGWQERLEQLGTALHGRGIETEVARRGGQHCRSSSCTAAPTSTWPSPTGRSAPWSGGCSRRSSAGTSGSASAGSTGTAPATSRPSGPPRPPPPDPARTHDETTPPPRRPKAP